MADRVPFLDLGEAYRERPEGGGTRCGGKAGTG